jgi:hypothetical protein
MQLCLSFLSGVLFFYLYQYFPISSLIIFISISVFLISRRKILLIILIAIGIFYAFSRYYPTEAVSDNWNKELKVTGRFSRGGNAGTAGKNIQTFVVDTAWDDESGTEVEELHDKEIGLPAKIFYHDKPFSLRPAYRQKRVLA